MIHPIKRPLNLDGAKLALRALRRSAPDSDAHRLIRGLISWTAGQTSTSAIRGAVEEVLADFERQYSRLLAAAINIVLAATDDAASDYKRARMYDQAARLLDCIEV